MTSRQTSETVDKVLGVGRRLVGLLPILTPLFFVFWWAIGISTDRKVDAAQAISRKEVAEQFQRSYTNRATERKDTNEAIADMRKETSDTIIALRREIADLRSEVRVLEALHAAKADRR